MVVSYTTMKTAKTKSTLVSESKKSIPNIALHVSVTDVYKRQRQEGSVPFIRAVIAQRNYKSAEEIVEIEKACDVTADMHIDVYKRQV